MRRVYVSCAALVGFTTDREFYAAALRAAAFGVSQKSKRSETPVGAVNFPHRSHPAPKVYIQL
jgi:hypothetical protein